MRYPRPVINKHLKALGAALVALVVGYPVGKLISSTLADEKSLPELADKVVEQTSKSIPMDIGGGWRLEAIARVEDGVRLRAAHRQEGRCGDHLLHSDHERGADDTQPSHRWSCVLVRRATEMSRARG